MAARKLFTGPDDRRIKRALCIVAHPDDIEFYCGGTVLKMRGRGVLGDFVLATSGDKGARDASQSRAHAQAEPAGSPAGTPPRVPSRRRGRTISSMRAEIASRLWEPPVAGPRLDVKTSVFEGPLELLLALAEREEVDIFQVSLSHVTDAYLAEIAAREVADPQEMAEFLWMAARLLLLKSIRLLPGEPPTEEETDLLGWEEEVRKRLEEYRAYKQMAEGLMERAEQETFSFPPPARPVGPGGQGQPLEIGLLCRAFTNLPAPIPPRPVGATGRTWPLAVR